jgi:hypothetical protein
LYKGRGKSVESQISRRKKSIPQPSSTCVVWFSTPNHKTRYSAATNYENRLIYIPQWYLGWFSHTWQNRAHMSEFMSPIFATHRAGPRSVRAHLRRRERDRQGAQSTVARNVGMSDPASPTVPGPPLIWSRQAARLDWEPVEINDMWGSTEAVAELRDAAGRVPHRRRHELPSSGPVVVGEEGLGCSHIRCMN